MSGDAHLYDDQYPESQRWIGITEYWRLAENRLHEKWHPVAGDLSQQYLLVDVTNISFHHRSESEGHGLDRYERERGHYLSDGNWHTSLLLWRELCPHAVADAERDSDSADSDTRADGYPDAIPHPFNADGHLHTNADQNADANADTHTEQNAHAHLHANHLYANAQPDENANQLTCAEQHEDARDLYTDAEQNTDTHLHADA